MALLTLPAGSGCGRVGFELAASDAEAAALTPGADAGAGSVSSSGAGEPGAQADAAANGSDGGDPAANGPSGGDPRPTCGDGVIEGDEECDDGGESADCNADCTRAECGDGNFNPLAGEECDDGKPSKTCDKLCLRICANADETCDGVDDDCDGLVDDDYVGAATGCGVGECQGNTGIMLCVDGSEQDSCDPLSGAASDANCDGADDDCDGTPDDDYQGAPTTCGVGSCAGNTGAMVCVDGTPVDGCDAMAGAAASDATCNGVDDDCDGPVDEDWAATASTCGVGACSANTGLTTCTAGVAGDTCNPLAGATSDANCNGRDDDCDGPADDDYVPAATSCGVGACAGNAGSLLCNAGTPNDTCDPMAGAAADDATCDGVDDDCDGVDDEDAVIAANWWDTDYQERRQLTFNNLDQDESLPGFPVLVVLKDSGPDAFDYGQVEADGKDLRFLDDDHSTELAYHIESWDPAGSSYIWVRVPSIDANSTTDHIWMYYGNGDAAADEKEADTYDPSYAAVFHLDESAGDYTESQSGTACSWESAAGAERNVVGAISGAVKPANDAGVVCPNDMLSGMTDYTLTAWVFPAGAGGSANFTVVSGEKLSGAFEGPGLYLRKSDRESGVWMNGTDYVYGPSLSVPALAWSFVALRVEVGSSGLVEMKVGQGPWQEVFTGDTRNERVVGGAPICIGKWLGPGGSASYHGRIDEVQISSELRPDAFVAAQYLSQTDAFIGYGAADDLACN